MRTTFRSSSLLRLLIAAATLATPALLAACGDGDPVGTGGGGAGGGTTTNPTTTGTGGHDAGPMSVDRWGARVRGQVLALSRVDRELWFGTSALPDPDAEKPLMRGGLGRLNLDTGEVRIFEGELPSFDYGAGGPEALEGPVPTATVVKDGDRRLVLARSGILVVEGEKFSEHAIEPAAGVKASPNAIAIDRSGGRKRIWASTDMGVVRLDADTFAAEAFYATADTGAEATGQMAIDPESGAVYIAAYAADPTSFVLRIDDDGVSTFVPGEGGAPSGVVGDVVWSSSAKAAMIALASWDPSTGGVVKWSGAEASQVVTEGQLAIATRAQAGAFGAAALAIDEADGVLVVGGQLRSVGIQGVLEGGGLAWVDLKTGKLAGLAAAKGEIPGEHVTAIAYDPTTRRTFAQVKQPCNDHKLGNLGLYAISFRDDGSLRFERPILSGVRSAAVIDGKVYLGLRDDNTGLACDGYPIQTGLVELRGNRSGELVPLAVALGEDAIQPYAGPTAIDALRATQLAIGTDRDGTFIGDPKGGYAFNQASRFQVSLHTSDVAWDGEAALWIAGPTSHAPEDPEEWADHWPRGAARLEVSADGKVTAGKHFVRASDDEDDITGLPSSEVADVLVDDDTAYLACATERVSPRTRDRDLGVPFALKGEVRTGGVAKVLPGGTIQVLSTAGELPDPRGIAFDAEGALLVLDAQKGLMRRAGSAFEALTLPASIPDGAYPRGLWAAKSGDDLVALYDKGAMIAIGGDARFVDGVGYAWRAIERSRGVVLVLTDEGLVRARVHGEDDVVEAAPGKGELPPFEVVSQ